jgi:hypothetical protein
VLIRLIMRWSLTLPHKIYPTIMIGGYLAVNSFFASDLCFFFSGKVFLALIIHFYCSIYRPTSVYFPVLIGFWEDLLFAVPIGINTLWFLGSYFGLKNLKKYFMSNFYIEWVFFSIYTVFYLIWIVLTCDNKILSSEPIIGLFPSFFYTSLLFFPIIKGLKRYGL